MKPKVLFISSAQPSANPRLLKEAKALFENGFNVCVMWCPISRWADEFDQKLFREFSNITWVKAGYHSKLQPLGYWYARIRKSIWILIYKLAGNQFDAAIKSLVLYSQELTSVASNFKADLYIGHNLGSLPAIVKASAKYRAKSIFDFEDFHRGESNEHSDSLAKIMQVENRYIPLLSLITSASPAITLAYKNLFPNLSIQTINNCFPLSYAIDQLCDLQDKPLKLFWFSQYLGKKRGLETVIESMSHFPKNKITLTLLGSASNETKAYFQNLFERYDLLKDNLSFIDPVFEKDIIGIASQYHVGLASEPGRDVNNELALSNKIMMYLLAGNALLCSDTISQKSFFNENPNIGQLYLKENVLDLTEKLKIYLSMPELLTNHRRNGLCLAKTKYNWDIEKNYFIHNVKSVLAS